MQIPSNNIGLQQKIQVNTRPERIISDDARERQSDVSELPASVAPAGVDLEAEFQRRVELSQVIADSRRSDNIDQNLPRGTQQALKAFNEASPSVEQQLGIEIVGIDTFA